MIKKIKTLTMSKLRASTFTDEVFATGEGYTHGNQKKAVALPWRGALYKWVRISYPETQKQTIVQCLDVGPYLWWDEDFLMRGQRPLVERHYNLGLMFPSKDDGNQKWSKISYSGKVPPSRASIDLTPPVWLDLGLVGRLEDFESFSVDNLFMEWFVPNPKEEGNEDEFPEWLNLG